MRASRLVLFFFAGLAVNALAQPPARDAPTNVSIDEGEPRSVELKLSVVP